MNPPLFAPFSLREVRFRNRLVVSPMCQYSAREGLANDWHLAHLGRFALGGFGGVIVEATAVAEIGRITPGDLGLWSDTQIAPLQRVTDFLKGNGAVPAIQLSHAGRKASSQRPWEGNGPLSASARPQDAWPTVAPSALPMAAGWPTPLELNEAQMTQIVGQWESAARRADAAGFELIEIHAAHGYLLHSFLSPLSNERTDRYGGDLEGRMRFPLQVVEAVRKAWPESKPLAVRISAIDDAPGGATIEDSVCFSKALRLRGVDIVDCSSGGLSGGTTIARVPRRFGFQVPLAEQIRREAGIPTIAVGLILDPALANQVVANEQADLIAIGREALASPNWPLDAHRLLTGEADYGRWPEQAGWWLERREHALKAARAAERQN